MKTNYQLELAYNFVQYTNKNIFLTGKAGTGKTTFLHHLKEKLPKRMIVVAPTGVAAINAGGVTIHSFFQMPFGPILPGRMQANQNNESRSNRATQAAIYKFSKSKINIIKSLDLLVIDEISMVRADLLDGIDEILRRFRKNSKPFGGVQLLMIGDLQQLAPIVKDDEWELLKEYYPGMFFFNSIALQKSQYTSIELKQVFRQTDNDFISILNEIRGNTLSEDSLKKLQDRYQPNFQAGTDEGYIHLTTHNNRAKNINDEKLSKLKTTSRIFEAQKEGIFPEHAYPTEEKLVLKEGAQIMFVKNDSSHDKLFFNGKIGKIIKFDGDEIIVKCPGDPFNITVHPEEWQNLSYTINKESKDIEEKIMGTFTQYPLKPAWAITIHKSQGLTFEKAIIDANAAFAHGQVYVALSRCKTLEGMVLSSPISQHAIIHDRSVSKFSDDAAENQPDQNVLEQSKKEFSLSLLNELFDFSESLKLLYYCNKHLKENAEAILGNLPEKLAGIIPDVKNQLVLVADKFRNQLQTILNEGNEKLFQERIVKASAYFKDQNEQLIVSMLDQASFDTDNKAVEKAVGNLMDELANLTNIKLICLEACSNGFELKRYLETRAKAFIDEPGKKRKTKEEPALDTVEHPEVFNRLKKWRKELADKNDQPAYWVASQKVLIQLSNQLPVTGKELLSVKGMGKKKLAQFGLEILEIIASYRKEKGMEVPELPTSIELPPPAPKIDTKKISFDHFESGKTITEIAQIREMATSTIEGHLAHYVGTGDLKLEQFLDKQKAELIETYFKQNKPGSLTEAKNNIDGDVSYADLRFVLKHIEFNGNQNQ